MSMKREATITSASPIHKTSEIPVWISPETSDRMVYRTGSTSRLPDGWAKTSGLTQEQARKWQELYASGSYGTKGWIKVVAISSVGLMELMNALDVRIVKDERVDDRSIDWYVEWSYRISITGPDGSEHELGGAYAMDLRLPSDTGDEYGGARYREAYETNRARMLESAAAKKTKQDHLYGGADKRLAEALGILDEAAVAKIEALAIERSKSAVLKMRAFIIPRAQTGARSRALRSYGVKSWYFPHELEPPIIVKRTEFNYLGAQQELGTEFMQQMLARKVAQEMGLSYDAVVGMLPSIPQVAPVPVEAEVTEIKAPVHHERVSFKEVHEMAFLASSKDRESLPAGMLIQYIASIKELLEKSGYDTQDKRSNLLSALFGEAQFPAEYPTGWLVLLEMFALAVRDDDEGIGEADNIVKYGVENQIDWFGAIEAMEHE